MESASPNSPTAAEPPLVVDLDGTLVFTDLLAESAFKLLRDSPLRALSLPLRAGRGRAGLKDYIARHTAVRVEDLPYNQPLLQWLRDQGAAGRTLVLCTASNHRLAQQVANHLQLFDDVIASNADSNLKARHKADALVARFGEAGFDYVADARADLPVWARARDAIVVSNDSTLFEAVRCHGSRSRRADLPDIRRQDWLRGLRIQQWLKNLLLFAPALAAHNITEPGNLAVLLLAFLAFSCCASATYLLNDLLDLESDRRHPRKRLRPLASGKIPILRALAVAGGLLVLGLAIATTCGSAFLLSLAAYLVLTGLYSLLLKRRVLLDCITLAILYTLRIVAGAAALEMQLSFWLLAFSLFLFLSLAFVKRYAEIEVQQAQGVGELHGRDYFTSDGPLVQALGVGAGFAAALVLSLYLNSEQVLLLYATPEFVWGAVVVLVYWISWMWLQAHRGQMHDDPLVFAVKHPTSLCAGALFLLTLLAGSTTW